MCGAKVAFPESMKDEPDPCSEPVVETICGCERLAAQAADEAPGIVGGIDLDGVRGKCGKGRPLSLPVA